MKRQHCVQLILSLVLATALGLVLAVPVVAADASRAAYPQTRQLIEFVDRAVELFERDGHEACKAFKVRDGEWRRGAAYVFVLDFDGKAHCHPAQPELEGTSLSGLHDVDGKPIMDLMLRALAGRSHGWVHYLWPRPGESLQSWKSTYLRRAGGPDGVEYIVASGAYNLPMEKLFVIDRVDAAARLLAAEGEKAFAALRSRAGGFVFLDAYVFVMSIEGTMLAHASSPELEGQGVLDVRDPEGIYPGREMLKLLETEEAGWVEYFWPRPDESDPVFKETYVRKVEMGQRVVVVGAGVYVE